MIDENLPLTIVELSRQKSIETHWVRDELPGAPDSEILGRLFESGETLVTRDIRFANHVLDQMVSGKRLGGVILIREQKIADLVLAWERWLEQARTPLGIAVLTRTGMRFREYPPSQNG